MLVCLRNLAETLSAWWWAKTLIYARVWSLCHGLLSHAHIAVSCLLSSASECAGIWYVPFECDVSRIFMVKGTLHHSVTRLVTFVFSPDHISRHVTCHHMSHLFLYFTTFHECDFHFLWMCHVEIRLSSFLSSWSCCFHCVIITCDSDFHRWLCHVTYFRGSLHCHVMITIFYCYCYSNVHIIFKCTLAT
jgi:hypothetical protein